MNLDLAAAQRAVEVMEAMQQPNGYCGRNGLRCMAADNVVLPGHLPASASTLRERPRSRLRRCCSAHDQLHRRRRVPAQQYTDPLPSPTLSAWAGVDSD